MTGAARRVRVAAPLKDSHNLQSIRLLAAGRQQAAANDGDIDFIYLHKSIASGEGGEPECPQNHGVCPRKKKGGGVGGQEKAL